MCFVCGLIVDKRKKKNLFNYVSIFQRKLAKKRKETLSSTRQEMTVMVNSMDKSYTEQGTNCDEALSFMDTHNLNSRCKSTCIKFTDKHTHKHTHRDTWCLIPVPLTCPQITGCDAVLDGLIDLLTLMLALVYVCGLSSNTNTDCDGEPGQN